MSEWAVVIRIDEGMQGGRVIRGLKPWANIYLYLSISKGRLFL